MERFLICLYHAIDINTMKSFANLNKKCRSTLISVSKKQLALIFGKCKYGTLLNS